jgi:hypothetical protein
MLICHAIIATLTMGMFVGTLKINVKNEIPRPVASSPSTRNINKLPQDFDVWN